MAHLILFRYIVSVSFLIALLILNIYRWQELNHLTGNRLYPLITVYLLSIPFIYIINTFEHPSGFLITLFFFYFFLAITWTILVEKRQITNLSILLFLLCLIPLIYGIYIHSNYEEQIDQDIMFLETKKKYYDDHLNNITSGIESGVLPSKLDITPIKNDIRDLRQGLKEMRKYYQRANYDKCNEEIKRLKQLTEKLDGDFEWLSPEKKVSDELHKVDKSVSVREHYLESLLTSLPNEDNNSEKIIYLKEIEYELSMIREKLDEAWRLYRKGEYMKTYEYVMGVKAEYYGDLREVDRKIEMVKHQIGGAT